MNVIIQFQVDISLVQKLYLFTPSITESLVIDTNELNFDIFSKSQASSSSSFELAYLWTITA
jgi:hypothetical protein